MSTSDNPFIQMHLNEIGAAEKALASAELEPIQNITLDTFESRLLPLIRRGEGTQSDVEAWLDITHHPHVAVHVYDGDVCKYKIPPLVNMGMTMPNGRFTYSDTLQEYRSRLDASPLDAYAFQNRAMNMMADTVTDSKGMYVEFIDEMNKIFKDYDMPVIQVRHGNATKSTVDETNDSQPSDELEVLGYDDI